MSLKDSITEYNLPMIICAIGMCLVGVAHAIFHEAHTSPTELKECYDLGAEAKRLGITPQNPYTSEDKAAAYLKGYTAK